MKKIKIIVPILAILLCMGINFIPVNAQWVEVITANDSTVIDAQYGFSPRFIQGKTTVSEYGFITNNADRWKNDGGSMNYPVMRLTNENKGKGAIYRNVGSYYGKIVDLKITVLDWGELPDVRYLDDGKVDYPHVTFRNDLIAVEVSSNSAKRVRYRMDLLYNNTNTIIPNIKWHANFQDLDGNSINDNSEYIQPLSGFDTIILSKNTWLGWVGDRIKNISKKSTGNNDIQAYTTCLFSNGSMEYIYSVTDIDENPNISPGHTYSYRNHYWWIFNGDSTAPFGTPNISNTVNDKNSDVVPNNSEITYKINFSISGSTFKYSYININNDMPLCYDIKNYKINDDEGRDVTDNFNYTNTNNKLLWSLKNPNDDTLYNKNYEIQIVVKKKDNYNMTNWISNNDLNISNVSTITTNYGTKSAMSTNIKIYSNITTSVTNGLITETDNQVMGGNNKIISYSPSDSNYVLDSILVDGANIDILKYPNSYTFYNVTDNHTIDVKYRRVYNVMTSVNNKNGGTVSESFTKIEKGEKVIVTYKPNSDFYIENLIVDGKTIEYDINGQYKDSYIFDNINENHTIEIIYKPYMNLNLSKELYDKTDKSNIKKLSTLNDFIDCGLHSDNYNFNINLIDTTNNSENKIIISSVNNKKSTIFKNLKSGHTYKLVENPNIHFIFDNIKVINTSFIQGVTNNNLLTFTISTDSDIPQTYEVTSQSSITKETITMPHIVEYIKNLLKVKK